MHSITTPKTKFTGRVIILLKIFLKYSEFNETSIKHQNVFTNYTFSKKLTDHKKNYIYDIHSLNEIVCSQFFIICLIFKIIIYILLMAFPIYNIASACILSYFDLFDIHWYDIETIKPWSFWERTFTSVTNLLSVARVNLKWNIHAIDYHDHKMY